MYVTQCTKIHENRRECEPASIDGCAAGCRPRLIFLAMKRESPKRFVVEIKARGMNAVSTFFPSFPEKTLLLI